MIVHERCVARVQASLVVLGSLATYAGAQGHGAVQLCNLDAHTDGPHSATVSKQPD
jgi:hypothetical protein